MIKIEWGVNSIDEMQDALESLAYDIIMLKDTHRYDVSKREIVSFLRGEGLDLCLREVHIGDKLYDI